MNDGRLKATKLILLSMAGFLMIASAITQTALPSVGTQDIVKRVDGVDIEAKVQSPSAQETPLQVVCLFEYTEGDIFNPPALAKDLNGMVHVDEALHGLIERGKSWSRAQVSPVR